MRSVTRQDGDPAVEKLKAAGLRVTRARSAIIRALDGAEAPKGLGELEAMLAVDGVPRSTVYRVVNELTERGILHRYEFDEGFARYEIAEGARGHHHHFVCRSCATVLDLDGLGDLERHVGRAEAALEAGRGIKIDGHRLDLFGLCAGCVGGEPRGAR